MTRVAAAQAAAIEGKEVEAARAFEKLLATQLVRELRRSLPEGVFGGGSGSDIYESWFDEHIGDALAKQDALGLAGMVKTALGRSASTEGSDE